MALNGAEQRRQLEILVRCITERLRSSETTLLEGTATTLSEALRFQAIAFSKVSPASGNGTAVPPGGPNRAEGPGPRRPRIRTEDRFRAVIGPAPQTGRFPRQA